GVLVLALGLLVPWLLSVAFAYLLATGRGGGRAGLLLGGGVAAWASLCWLSVPYCGGYPCLPGLMVAEFARVSPAEAARHELTVHATNFLLWPGMGWLAFGLRRCP